MEFPPVPNDPALDPKFIDEMQVLSVYSELFPHYAWTDAQTAMDLMRGEILTLRNERDAFKVATTTALRELTYLAEQVKAREGGSVYRAIDACRLALGQVPVVHGRNCPKEPHKGTGYLHDHDDDSPYDVDGVLYCGRCHNWLHEKRDWMQTR